jgi:hypothetical protein
MQQREEGDVKLGDVAQLHQRGFAALQALTLQRGGEVIHLLVELAVAVLPSPSIIATASFSA